MNAKNDVADSGLDTVLTLPEETDARAIAAGCREVALTFINEAHRWGKAELAMWLIGPYSQLARYGSDFSRRRSGEISTRVPLLREIDARMVDRVIRTAREEVLATLAQLSAPEAGASFAFTMISAGFAVRCEDIRGKAGWVPTTDARRLADRVLSLLAVDYLVRPTDYEENLHVCAHCGWVEIRSSQKLVSVCACRGSGIFSQERRATLPYFPDRSLTSFFPDGSRARTSLLPDNARTSFVPDSKRARTSFVPDSRRPGASFGPDSSRSHPSFFPDGA